MVLTVAAEGSTEWVTGSLRKRRTSRSTLRSRVAEKSIVWPPVATCSSSSVTCGMKPMSAIWSASSSTVTATPSSWQSPRWIRSFSRPGVATTTSAPRFSAWA